MARHPLHKTFWQYLKQNAGQPPNLDEMFSKLYHKVLKSVGGKSDSKQDSEGPEKKFLITFLIVVLLAVWALSGIFIVSPAEKGVVLRFGRYQRTVEPGPHWIPRFIQTVYKVNVQQISSFSYEADMLTKDENIVFVSLSVQFRVADPYLYLFSVTNPVSSLQQATASALRQVVGNTTLDSILTVGRAQAREAVEKRLNTILAAYKTGFEITDVNLQPAQPPEEVTEAFDDAIKAREDEQRYINWAEAYKERVVRIATGQANQILQAAKAYQEKVILQARADTASYLAILPQYQRARTVTRDRLYLDAMSDTFKHMSKVLVDMPKGTAPLMYLPVDKMLSLAKGNQDSSSSEKPVKPVEQSEAEHNRGRAGRSDNLLSLRERYGRRLIERPSDRETRGE